jgi:hypothetical protein
MVARPSLTVIGPGLAMADAFATAGFAMGEPGIAWVGQQRGFGAVGITADDRMVSTPLAHDLLVVDPEAVPGGPGGPGPGAPRRPPRDGPALTTISGATA